MKLTQEQVRHVAELARLQLTPEEEVRYADQLSAILGHIGELTALDTKDVEPMTHATAEPMYLRPDVPQPSLGGAKTAALAPASVGTSIAVPKIIE